MTCDGLIPGYSGKQGFWANVVCCPNPALHQIQGGNYCQAHFDLIKPEDKEETTIVRHYEWYDGPLVFSLSKRDEHLICLALPNNDFLAVEVSEQDLEYEEPMDLRDLMLEGERRWGLGNWVRSKACLKTELKTEPIPEEYLPLPGYFIKLKEASVW